MVWKIFHDPMFWANTFFCAVIGFIAWKLYNDSHYNYDKDDDEREETP